MKNRTIIGVICLVLAIIVTFVVAPLINRLADDTEEVVIVLQDIKQGSVITKEMVRLADFSKNNLPKNPIPRVNMPPWWKLWAMLARCFVSGQAARTA